MNRLPFFLFLFCLSACPFGTNAFSQDISYGFKAGLNFNSFSGDGEMDDNGQTVEEYTGNTGFHLGVSFTWKATDLMGLRSEVLYSQKGSRRSFDGQSYYIFNTQNGSRVRAFGIRDQDLNITTSYIDFPVTGYFKPVEWLEVYGGANVGILVAASGFGGITFSGQTSGGSPVAEFVHDLKTKYTSDKAGEADIDVNPATVQVGNQTGILPRSGGAYFEFDEDRGKLYRTLDFGLIGGVSFYLSKGLFVSCRLNYGLTDITKSQADVSLVKLDNGEFISRNDDDRNVSIQASVGFSF